jgi:hypothetical protein
LTAGATGPTGPTGESEFGNNFVYAYSTDTIDLQALTQCIFTPVPFTTPVEIDGWGWTNGTPTDFTCNQDGTYLVIYRTHIYSNVTQGFLNIVFRARATVNGVEIPSSIVNGRTFGLSPIFGDLSSSTEVTASFIYNFTSLPTPDVLQIQIASTGTVSPVNASLSPMDGIGCPDISGTSAAITITRIR